MAGHCHKQNGMSVNPFEANMNKHLELPFANLLREGSNVLIAGMGGGFDVFCGLPIYFELKQRGYRVHLASLSFAELSEYTDCQWLSSTLVGVGPAPSDLCGYHPERFLARWFREAHDDGLIVWCFLPTGVQPLIADYRLLIDLLDLDAIVLVDGGVDSLTRGDEERCGTILEDYASLSAVSCLAEVPIRVMACIGMGVEGDVCHACVLENVASLIRDGGLLGVTALMTGMHAFELYRQAVTYVHEQPGQQPSVINASILSAASGQFGDYHATERTRGSELSISPLMSMYLFFDVDSVAAQNRFVSDLVKTNSMADAFGAIYEARERMTLREPKPFRLP